MSMKTNDAQYERAYDRAALRSAFVSLFWSVITARKKRTGGFTLQALAKAIGSTKHEVSRWFNGDPNWTLNTIANLASALDLDLVVQARERSTGIVFTAAGIQSPMATPAVPSIMPPMQIDAMRSFRQSGGGTLTLGPSLRTGYPVVTEQIAA